MLKCRFTKTAKRKVKVLVSTMRGSSFIQRSQRRSKRLHPTDETACSYSLRSFLLKHGVIGPTRSVERLAVGKLVAAKRKMRLLNSENFLAPHRWAAETCGPRKGKTFDIFSLAPWMAACHATISDTSAAIPDCGNFRWSIVCQLRKIR